jgi:hypothetical protein
MKIPAPSTIATTQAMWEWMMSLTHSRAPESGDQLVRQGDALVEQSIARADDGTFNEADHPRAANGQFGSGGGGAAPKNKKEISDRLKEIEGEHTAKKAELHKMIAAKTGLTDGKRKEVAKSIFKLAQERDGLSKELETAPDAPAEEKEEDQPTVENLELEIKDIEAKIKDAKGAEKGALFGELSKLYVKKQEVFTAGKKKRPDDTDFSAGSKERLDKAEKLIKAKDSEGLADMLEEIGETSNPKSSLSQIKDYIQINLADMPRELDMEKFRSGAEARNIAYKKMRDLNKAVKDAKGDASAQAAAQKKYNDAEHAFLAANTKHEQQFNKWKNSITLEGGEKLAISNYTTSGYRQINKSLYDPMPSMTESWVKTDIAHLDAAIEKSVLPADVDVFRGMSLPGDQVDSLIEGSELSNMAFTSVSTNEDVSEGFTTGMFNPKSKAVMIRMTLPQGSKGYPMGGNEGEIILPRGAKMRVVKKEAGMNSYGAHTVYLHVEPILDSQARADSVIDLSKAFCGD